jgi:hypothetical protein
VGGGRGSGRKKGKGKDNARDTDNAVGVADVSPQTPMHESPDPRRIPIDGKTGILIALHESPTGLCILGAFTERRKAWAACVKHRRGPEFAGFLDMDERGGNVNGHWVLGVTSTEGGDELLPRMRAREVGVGRHEWRVGAWRVDEEVLE